MKFARSNRGHAKSSRPAGRSLDVLAGALVAAAVFAAVPSAYAQDGADEAQPAAPQTADPTEKYNLPPNFDPNFRPKRTPTSQKVTLDFRQAQLDEVVKMFSSIMEKNFIISDSINTAKTITIISPKAVSVNEAYRAFLAALQMNGLTVVPFGSFLKIVESKNAIVEPMTPYAEGERIPNEARMVTAIIPVESASVEEIQQVISKFVTPDATIIPYGSSLIINENAANLRRIESFIERLDKGDAANNVYVYKVLYAEAGEVKGKLEEIFSAQQGQTRSRAARRTNSKAASTSAESTDLGVELSEIIADERTNQLIIVSDKRSFAKIKEMLDILDVPTAVGGQIHVKFLEYANAEELASTLSSLASGSGGTSRSGSTATRAVAARRTQAAAAESGSEVADLLSGEVQITSHKPTNSLVVVASPRDYLALENVIDLLDRPRKQVYVEAVIMEIGLDVNRNINMGFNLGLGQDFDGVIPESAIESGAIDDTNGLMLGQSNFPGLAGLGSAISGAGGAIGLLGPLVSIPGTSISLPAFALLLQATQTDTSVNILSTPAVMTMDNEEAEIVVGERIAFQRGVTAGAGAAGLSSLLGGVTGADTGALGGLGALGALGGLGGLGGLIAPIDYQDVGITLRILPQVNESDYVRLEVNQEVSDIKGAGTIQGAPDRTQRSIKTIVLVKDQSTVVIGGLIRDVENETVEKVPFLGDIPLIGVLFRNTGTINTKQNLVLMLTPYIIESEADLKKIHDRKMEEREELLKLFGSRDLQYIKNVNFDKKAGLLSRMKGQIEEAQTERAAREAALEAFELDGPRYQLLGGEVDAADPDGDPARETLPDGGVRFDPEAVDTSVDAPAGADGE